MDANSNAAVQPTLHNTVMVLRVRWMFFLINGPTLNTSGGVSLVIQ